MKLGCHVDDARLVAVLIEESMSEHMSGSCVSKAFHSGFKHVVGERVNRVQAGVVQSSDDFFNRRASWERIRMNHYKVGTRINDVLKHDDLVSFGRQNRTSGRLGHLMVRSDDHEAFSSNCDQRRHTKWKRIRGKLSVSECNQVVGVSRLAIAIDVDGARRVHSAEITAIPVDVDPIGLGTLTPDHTNAVRLVAYFLNRRGGERSPGIGLNLIGSLAEVLSAIEGNDVVGCLLYTSPSPRDKRQSRMPSSA